MDKVCLCALKLNNLPSYELHQYSVFRYVEGELWFYGSYETSDRADNVATKLGNGLVIEVKHDSERVS